MPRRLPPADRAILAAVRQTRVPVEPSDPRWTHPLARMFALALGFDPDTGKDVVPWVHPTGSSDE